MFFSFFSTVFLNTFVPTTIWRVMNIKYTEKHLALQ